MSIPSLFDPVQVGAWSLPNRVAMAPLTRNRAPGQVPTPQMATYYAQRAHPQHGAGLIVTEGTAPAESVAITSMEGNGRRGGEAGVLLNLEPPARVRL